MSRYSFDTTGMSNRDNNRLNCEIECFIEQWWGTCRGMDVKNMFENGTPYICICECMGIAYSDFSDD